MISPNHHRWLWASLTTRRFLPIPIWLGDIGLFNIPFESISISRSKAVCKCFSLVKGSHLMMSRSPAQTLCAQKKLYTILLLSKYVLSEFLKANIITNRAKKQRNKFEIEMSQKKDLFYYSLTCFIWQIQSPNPKKNISLFGAIIRNAFISFRAVRSVFILWIPFFESLSTTLCFSSFMAVFIDWTVN